MSISTLNCHDVANYFLSLTDEEVGDLISNLKLQKLVYYAQGFWLALHNEPLFPEPIEAWTHGPVVPELYHVYKKYGANAIPRPKYLDFSKYTTEVRELLDEIYVVYGQYSAAKLRNMTHEESPWRDYQINAGTISHEAMKAYFRTQLNNG